MCANFSDSSSTSSDTPLNQLYRQYRRLQRQYNQFIDQPEPAMDNNQHQIAGGNPQEEPPEGDFYDFPPEDGQFDRQPEPYLYHYGGGGNPFGEPPVIDQEQLRRMQMDQLQAEMDRLMGRQRRGGHRGGHRGGNRGGGGGGPGDHARHPGDGGDDRNWELGFGGRGRVPQRRDPYQGAPIIDLYSTDHDSFAGMGHQRDAFTTRKLGNWDETLMDRGKNSV